ncbi:MAG: hypothetical protein A4E28_00541 [Methanocella sp. PtaU1.Bin125]|nr:MAG: hypothetical protein A4E28_00541 [Methanocella sp. PtaU1.Bin125]
MAGVGRRSDFGKPDYDTNADVENRLDTTDPLIDLALPYEGKIKALMDRGMTREQAEDWVDHAMQDAREREFRKREMLEEQTRFRKEIGDLKHCTAVDESCIPTGPEDEPEKARHISERHGPLPEK